MQINKLIMIVKILLILPLITEASNLKLQEDRQLFVTVRILLETLDKHILSRAKLIRDQVANFQTPLNIGRKSILEEMERHPEQLRLDIPRSSIRIGKDVVSPETKKKSIERQYQLLASRLEEYVQEQRPHLLNPSRAGKLGEFFAAEIIYSIVQTFQGPVQVRAYKDEPILKSGDWGQLSQQSIQTTAIFFPNPTTDSLHVLLTTEKSLKDVSEKLPDKKFITEATTIFNLASGEVSFRYRYVIEDKEVSWDAIVLPKL